MLVHALACSHTDTHACGHTSSHTPLRDAASLKLSAGNLCWEEQLSKSKVRRRWFALLAKLAPVPQL